MSTNTEKILHGYGILAKAIEGNKKRFYAIYDNGNHTTYKKGDYVVTTGKKVIQIAEIIPVKDAMMRGISLARISRRVIGKIDMNAYSTPEKNSEQPISSGTFSNAANVFQSRSGYGIKVSYSWGDEDFGLYGRFCSEEAAYKAMCLYAAKEAFVQNEAFEKGKDCSIDFKPNEKKIMLHYLIDDTWCIFEVAAYGEKDLENEFKLFDDIGFDYSSLKVKTRSGVINAIPMQDSDYPGIDIEYIANEDSGEKMSNPRIFMAQSEGDPIRAVVWNDSTKEGYTQIVNFA